MLRENIVSMFIEVPSSIFSCSFSLVDHVPSIWNCPTCLFWSLLWFLTFFLYFYFSVQKAALARLEALENDNAGADNVETNDDDYDSLDDEDQGMIPSLFSVYFLICFLIKLFGCYSSSFLKKFYFSLKNPTLLFVSSLMPRFVIFVVYIQKKQSKNMKRKTRQAKALENAKKAPRTFMEVLQEVNIPTKCWLKIFQLELLCIWSSFSSWEATHSIFQITSLQ